MQWSRYRIAAFSAGVMPAGGTAMAFYPRTTDDGRRMTDDGRPTTDHRPRAACDGPGATETRGHGDAEPRSHGDMEIGSVTTAAPSQPTADHLRDLRDLPHLRDTSQTHRSWDDVLLAYLPDGTPVYGVLDTDRTPLYARVETPAWSASATAAGHLGLTLRAGDQTVELELTVASRWCLRDFLSRDTLDRLLIAANMWEQLGRWCAEDADDGSG